MNLQKDKIDKVKTVLFGIGHISSRIKKLSELLNTGIEKIC